MAYLTERFLLEKGLDTIVESRASRYERLYKLSGNKQLFLSHSHKDRNLAKGLKNYLYEIGIELYIDWEDASMPPNTNEETAQKIKIRIKGSDGTLVLATKNAMNSRWVPWEIGIADIYNTPSKIFIIPVVDQSGTFYGNEYLQLYKRLEFGDNYILGAFNPGETQGSTFKYITEHSL